MNRLPILLLPAGIWFAACDDVDGKEKSSDQPQPQTKQEGLCELTAEMMEICEPGREFSNEDMQDCLSEAQQLTDECYGFSVLLMACQRDNEACGLDVFEDCSSEFNDFSSVCATE